MSTGRSSDQRTPQERAEQFMERVTANASRRLTRFMGRAREELEDIVAEARSLNERQQPGRSRQQAGGARPGSKSRSNSGAANKS